MKNLAISLLAGVMLTACLACNVQPEPGGISLTTEVKRSPWNSSHSTGEILTTRHYRIYTTSKDSRLLRLLPGFLEATYLNYLHLTGLADRQAPEPMPLYMMATRREWALLTENVVSRAQRSVYLSIEAGGYCYRGICVFWDIGGAATFAIAGHEGLHQFLHHRLRNPLPLWLEEGLCVAAEGHEITGNRVRFTPKRNPSRVANLRTAIVQGWWMPIRRILPLDAGDVAVRGTRHAVGYYAQLWALANFIRSHPVYSEGLRRLLADAEAGRFRQALNIPKTVLGQLTRRGRRYNQTMAEPLMRHYITEDLDTFDKEYLAFAKRVAGLE